MPGAKRRLSPRAWGATPFSSPRGATPSRACPAIPPSADSPKATSSTNWTPWAAKWDATRTRRPCRRRPSISAADRPCTPPAPNAPKRSMPSACNGLSRRHPTWTFSKTPRSKSGPTRSKTPLPRRKIRPTRTESPLPRTYPSRRLPPSAPFAAAYGRSVTATFSPKPSSSPPARPCADAFGSARNARKAAATDAPR